MLETEFPIDLNHIVPSNLMIMLPSDVNKENIDDYIDVQKLTPKLITRSIEILVEKFDLSYLDAITQVVDYHEIQLSDVKKLLSPQIIDKLKEESIKVNLIKDESKIESLF